MSQSRPGTASPLYRRALVVFSGATDLAWLRLLKPGFRHCFVAVDDGARWITVDALSHRTEILVHDLPPGFDLAGYYRGKGLTVLEVEPGPATRRPAPAELHSCVASIKRLLGIRARWIVTPWQLYRHLAAAPRRTRRVSIRKNFPRNILLEMAPPSPILRRAVCRLRRCRRRSSAEGRSEFMGALFSSPKAPPPPPPPVLETPDPEDETRKARLEALARRRRGRGGTIATSERGLLRQNGAAGVPKHLLGE